MQADGETYIRQADTYIHTYIQYHIHTCRHAYIHTHIHSYRHTYMHTHAHTHKHPHIHTGSRINIQAIRAY